MLEGQRFQVDSSKILLDQVTRTDYKEKSCTVRSTVLTGIPEMRLDPFSGKILALPEPTKEQYGLHLNNPIALRGLLTTYSENGQVDMTFILSTLPDHDGLLAQMREAGFPLELIRKRATKGVLIPLENIPINARAFLKTQHDGYRGGVHNYNTEIGHRYQTELDSRIRNQEITSALLGKVKDIANTAHQVLPAIAQQITGDAFLGSKMVCAAFDPTTSNFITL